jgi:drug/metabolite transporter (DMT)-like permease
VSPRLRSGTAVIAISSLFFGLMATMVRLLAGAVPSTQLTAVRFAVGLVGVGLIFLARGKRPNLKRWRLLALRGLFGGIAVVTYFFAIERLGAAAATVLNYSSPVYAAAFAAWFLHERTGPLARVGLLVATAGAALVAFGSGSAANPLVPDVGAIAGVLSAVAGGAAMTVIKRLRDDTDAETVFLAFCAVGLVVSLPLAAPGWVPMEGRALWIALGIGLLSIAGQLLFTWGMGFTTATAGSATTQLVPAVAWVLSLAWLGEPVTPLGAVGSLLCVGGVLLGVVPWRAALRPAPR